MPFDDEVEILGVNLSIPMGAPVGPPAVVFVPDPVAWWTFAPGTISGATVTDVTGNGHTGTTINSPSYSGNFIVLNGSTQYMTAPHDDALAPTSITIFMRLKNGTLTIDTSVQPVSTYTDIGLGGATTGGWTITATPTQNGKFGLVPATMALAAMSTGGINPSATWSMDASLGTAARRYDTSSEIIYCFVYDENDPLNWHWYVNGVDQGAADISTSNLGAGQPIVKPQPAPGGTPPLALGTVFNFGLSPSTFLFSSGSDMRIFNVPLSPTQIAAISV